MGEKMNLKLSHYMLLYLSNALSITYIYYKLKILEILGTDQVNTIREDTGTYPVHKFVIDIEQYLTSDKNIKLYLEYDGHNTRKDYSQAFTIETVKNNKRDGNGLTYEVIEVRNISNSYLTSNIRKNID